MASNNSLPLCEYVNSWIWVTCLLKPAQIQVGLPECWVLMPSTIPLFLPHFLIFIHSRFIFILKWLIRIIKMIRAGDGVEVGMAGRDVNCSRQHCDYGCGSWHVCTHAVIFPSLCLPPLFVFVCTHCHSSVLLPTIIDPCPYVPLSVKVCVHAHCACPCPFIHPWLYWLALIGPTSPRLLPICCSK